MDDDKLDKVIKGLEFCISSEDCRGCIYWDDVELQSECPLHYDALKLLKEQQKKIKSLEQTIEDICCG